MAADAPKTMPEYLRWLRLDRRAPPSALDPRYYAGVAERIRLQFERGFWTQVLDRLPVWDGQYAVDTGTPLLAPAGRPEVFTKPHGSFLLKTFRKNILDNPQFPEAPDGGWITPDTWFVQVRDVVRTSLVVRYLDGVPFLADRLGGLAEAEGVPCAASLQARHEGYYAAHLTTTHACEVPTTNLGLIHIDAPVEIQVRTEVQDLVRGLLHRFYALHRARPQGDRGGWEWNFGSDEFATNYLGHMVHYIEGTIVGLRNSSRREP